MTLRFEVGTVYKRKREERLYLAVNSRLLVTYVKGQLVERRPRMKYRRVGSISVLELRSTWRIPLMKVDDLVDLYLSPAAHRNSDVRQRRTERRGDADDELVEFLLLRLYGASDLSIHPQP